MTPIPVDLEPARDATGALQVCLLISGILRAAGRTIVMARILLGRQLLLVERHGLWQQMPGPRPVATWHEWLRHSFPAIAGLSHDIAFTSIALASSPVFAQMSAESLGRFSSLSNAIELVREARRRGGTVAPDLVEKAASLPVREFRRELGLPGKVQLSVVVEDKQRADKLDELLDLIKGADAAAIDALVEAVRWGGERSEGSPTYALIWVHACCYHEIQGEHG
jgi:hypothetical protein